MSGSDVEGWDNDNVKLPPTVVQYEQFLNETLRGDLKYVMLN